MADWDKAENFEQWYYPKEEDETPNKNKKNVKSKYSLQQVKSMLNDPNIVITCNSVGLFMWNKECWEKENGKKEE